ncbi:MAG TPA: hypothetical protein VF407_23185 [Polyangiaceae bacterium]
MEGRAVPIEFNGGSEDVGYRISFDARSRVITLRLRGFWDEAITGAFRKDFLAFWKAADRSRPYLVLADLSRYPTQRAPVQQVHAELMSKGKAMGVVRSANLVDATLTSMQIRRLSEQSGLEVFSFFQDEQAALAWLVGAND